MRQLRVPNIRGAFSSTSVYAVSVTVDTSETPFNSASVSILSAQCHSIVFVD